MHVKLYVHFQHNNLCFFTTTTTTTTTKVILFLRLLTTISNSSFLIRLLIHKTIIDSLLLRLLKYHIKLSSATFKTQGQLLLLHFYDFFNKTITMMIVFYNLCNIQYTDYQCILTYVIPQLILLTNAWNLCI